MPVIVSKHIEDPRLQLGVVEVSAAQVASADPALRAQCQALFKELSSGPEPREFPERERVAVRQLLKIGGFSPTGRNRPAQELLFNDLQERAASEDAQQRGFNHINNVVDINNLMSLRLKLPISIFDADKLEGRLHIRIAEEGEGYVFNASGHYLDLKRCIICACGPAPGRPCGSPVKDSMETKVFDGASSILGLVYSSSELYSSAELEAGLRQFAALLEEHCGAQLVSLAVL
ncbi:B3/4 domain-containing protein [bacterium]|nr:B3/4 domain-containing protein [bacterium]